MYLFVSEITLKHSFNITKDRTKSIEVVKWKMKETSKDFLDIRANRRKEYEAKRNQ
jgi:hypothetical protein